METGANDVLVVKGKAESIDRNERLDSLPAGSGDQRNKPWKTGTIRVDWDPEFLTGVDRCCNPVSGDV